MQYEQIRHSCHLNLHSNKLDKWTNFLVPPDLHLSSPKDPILNHSSLSHWNFMMLLWVPQDFMVFQSIFTFLFSIPQMAITSSVKGNDNNKRKKYIQTNRIFFSFSFEPMFFTFYHFLDLLLPFLGTSFYWFPWLLNRKTNIFPLLFWPVVVQTGSFSGFLCAMFLFF